MGGGKLFANEGLELKEFFEKRLRIFDKTNLQERRKK